LPALCPVRHAKNRPAAIKATRRLILKEQSGFQKVILFKGRQVLLVLLVKLSLRGKSKAFASKANVEIEKEGEINFTGKEVIIVRCVEVCKENF
jgi:hypothetical protein